MTVPSENAEQDLNTKQQKALTALLGSSTVTEAAVACSMSEATLFRFLRDKTFKVHYRQARSEIVDHAITQLQRDCATATRTLREVCEDGSEPASARVSAAKAILDGAVKAVELQDTAARLEALEMKLSEVEEGDEQIKKRIRRAEQRVTRQQVSRVIPTAAELWRWQLVSSVESTRQWHNDKLQAHQDVLKCYEDVRAASDDVLLEASGFPNVAGWGWLCVMVRDLTWFCLRAHNWNLPHLLFLHCHIGKTTEAERRAYAARHFCELMKLRGYDPLKAVREEVQRNIEKAQCSEDEYIEVLHKKNEWSYFVYTCEAVVIRPEVMSEGNVKGQVLYGPEQRAKYMAEMRGT